MKVDRSVTAENDEKYFERLLILRHFVASFSNDPKKCHKTAGMYQDSSTRMT